MVQSHPNPWRHHQKVKSSLIYIIMPTSSIQALYHLMSSHKGWVQYNKTFWERDNIHIMFITVVLFCCCSVTQSCPTLHDPMDCSSRPPCPSPSPGICPSSFPLHWWCHLANSSPVILFFCLQSFPASVSFPMSWLFASGDQSMGASTCRFTMLVIPTLTLNNLLIQMPRVISLTSGSHFQLSE